MWHDGLWVKLWDMGVKGRMWGVIKNMYEASRSAILLEGEKSAAFRVEQGVAQGCSSKTCVMKQLEVIWVMAVMLWQLHEYYYI